MSKLFIANWKSNKNREDVEKWMDKFEAEIKPQVALDKIKNDIVICPPMPSLMFISNRVLNRQLHAHTSVGIQDISPFSAGSYTGAVSGQNLVGFNVRYAIVGHSERRKYFKETSQDVALKVDQCLQNEIIPIVCVDRNEVQAQANAIDSKLYKKIIIAYEPVEHIGTGVAQSSEEVLAVFTEIKKQFPGAKIIYGGSVNPDNIAQFLSHSEIEGFLVGTASLNVDDFFSLVTSL